MTCPYSQMCVLPLCIVPLLVVSIPMEKIILSQLANLRVRHIAFTRYIHVDTHVTHTCTHTSTHTAYSHTHIRMQMHSWTRICKHACLAFLFCAVYMYIMHVYSIVFSHQCMGKWKRVLEILAHELQNSLSSTSSMCACYLGHKTYVKA